jgi:anti-anti-sigma regulatory factor
MRFAFTPPGFREEPAMLKLTWLTQASRVLILKLEGELLEPWVDVVRDACTKRGHSKRLRMDLAAVTYVDASGTQLLRDLMGEGVAIAACSSFVAELLNLEDYR